MGHWEGFQHKGVNNPMLNIGKVSEGCFVQEARHGLLHF